MTTLLLTHIAALDHDMGAGHPERAERLRAVSRALASPAFDALRREDAPLGELADVERVHGARYVEAIRAAAPTEGRRRIDADTAMSPGTWEAVMRGAGAAVRATDEVMTRRVDNAFVAMRPPGHHAERERAMGFCFFNNAAIAAYRARAVHGAERPAVVDFDVHHGNGTQDIFWADRAAFYASTHEMPLFPGTGKRNDRGEHGQIVNAPLRAGDGSERFREAFLDVVLPGLTAFSPDFLVISAGFDAHHRDPLGNLMLEAEDFAWATEKLLEVAALKCGGRVVSVLEGGYDLQGLAESTAAHVGVLMG